MTAPTVRVIGGRNPEILPTFWAMRQGWKSEPLGLDTYRLSKTGHVVVIHAPSIRAGHEITCIYSTLTSTRNMVGSCIVGEKLSGEELARAIDVVIASIMEPETVGE